MKNILSLAVLITTLLFATEMQAQQGSLTLVKTFDNEFLIEDYCMKVPMLSISEERSCYTEMGKEPVCEGETKLMLYDLYDADFNLHKTIYLKTLMPEAIRFGVVEDDTMGANRFMLTQTLFNDDDLIEIIVIGEDFFAIVNENGKVLFRDQIKNHSYVDFFVKVIGNKTYLHVREDSDARLYLIDKTATNNIEGNTITKAKAYPNPAREYINIPYDLQGAKRGTIIISDLQGKELIKATINDNQNTLRMSTDKLSAGLYIVAVTDGSKILSSEKVIVK